MEQITFVITSCGRPDLLKRTLNSFFKFNDYPIQEYILVEDSGDEGMATLLEKEYGDRFNILFNRPKLGQIRSIDRAYALVRTPYIFHCEDDWLFFRTGFIADSLAVLNQQPKATSVWLRDLWDTNGCRIDRRIQQTPAGVFYRKILPTPHLNWHGFTFNPGLRRLADYQRLAPFAKIGQEPQIDQAYAKLGYDGFILEESAVEHIGWERQVVNTAHAPSPRLKNSPYTHLTSVHNTTSAEQVVPLFTNILTPKTVIDIGCGLGAWLSIFAKHGAEEVLGIDGDWVDKQLLHISENQFKTADLTQPLTLEKRYDLALSLEVAEHLPESAADTFVQSLVNASDHIIFSAAVPFQGGQNHLNEQWPSYWVEKFEQHGYQFHDCIRPLIWNNKEVFVWYRQNIFLVSKQPSPLPTSPYLNLVHPQLYQSKRQALYNGSVGLRFGFFVFQQALRSFIKRKFRF